MFYFSYIIQKYIKNFFFFLIGLVVIYLKVFDKKVINIINI